MSHFFVLLIILFLANPVQAKIFDVTSYGAIGDGVTDDTLSIQVALNAASVKGGTVYFPSGTYCLSNNLEVKGSYVTLRGESAVLQICTFFNTPPFSGAVAAMLNLVGTVSTRLKHISIENLHFVGMPRLADQNEPKCLSALSADYVTIEGNVFENFGHECLWPAGAGIAPVHHWRIVNNDFFNIGVGGASPSAITINGRDFTVIGNTCDTVLGCIGASDQRAVIVGNIIRNVQGFGISSAGDAPGSDDVVISNNIIEVTAGNRARWAIAVVSGARNTNVTNNIIRLKTSNDGLTLNGIKLQGPHNGGMIANNSIYMDASGALRSGNALIGIAGFDNGQGLDVHIVDNDIHLVNENAFYTAGVQMRAVSPTDSMKAVLIGNRMGGFSRMNASYAVDLQKLAGSFSYWLIDMLADGGYWRFPNEFVADGRYDNVPVTLMHVE